MNINTKNKTRISPLILVLGGIHGVGKTTLAHQLSIELNIHQRAGLGAITKTMKTLLPHNEIIQVWGQYDTTDLMKIREKFLRECELIGRVMHTLVESAVKTGEDYIIDGVQLLPQYLPLESIHYCVITVSDSQEYKKRFMHPTDTRAKHLTNATTEIAKTIEEIILQEARKYNIPVFDNTGSFEKTSESIRGYFSI